MTTLHSFVFDGATRIGNDPCGITEKDLQNYFHTMMSIYQKEDIHTHTEVKKHSSSWHSAVREVFHDETLH